jgi:ribosomal protein S18 acetylase RimI-like enzyme
VELAGIRLMASGIAHPQWNNGDVTDPGAVDLDAVRAWYAERRVPWGVRVPAHLSSAWTAGRHLLRKTNMALPLRRYRPPPAPEQVTVDVATRDDLDDVVRVDAEAFEEDAELERAWVAPRLGAPGFVPVLARLAGKPVGVASAVRVSGRGGDSVGVFGVGVLTSARGRGIGAALTARAVEAGLEDGADLAFLNPDTGTAVRLYRRLGFTETDPFDVFVDL